MINIEFFHIYADAPIGEEQTAALPILRQTLQERKITDYSLCTLIDNYNAPETHDPKTISNYLMSQGLHSAVFFEADLVIMAQRILKELPNLRKETFRGSNKKVTYYCGVKSKIAIQEEFPDGRSRFTCSFLVACWSLYRLGYFPEVITNNTQLINILPAKYKETEAKAMEIIKALNVDAQKISHIFY